MCLFWRAFFPVLITQIDTDIRIRICIHKYRTVTRYRHTGHSITSKLLHVLWSTVEEIANTRRERENERSLFIAILRFTVHVKVHLSLKLLISFPNSTETIQCQLYFINAVIVRPFFLFAISFSLLLLLNVCNSYCFVCIWIVRSEIQTNW